MGRRIEEPEVLAVGLFAGLLCCLSPGLVAAALAAAIAILHVREDPGQGHLRTLAILAAIAVAGLVGGPALMTAAALCWRFWQELREREDASLQLAAAPFAALLFRLDAPPLVVAGAVCAALVATADWAIARLAEWRLSTRPQIAGYIGAQATLATPLLVLPTPGACLAAFVAMALLRASTRVEAPVRYALA